MKAEVIRWNNSLYRYTIKIINGISYGRMSKEKAQKIAGKLNSALASHVQSELSAKIAEIEKTFTDEYIENEWKEYLVNLKYFEGARDMRSEILKILKGE